MKKTKNLLLVIACLSILVGVLTGCNNAYKFDSIGIMQPNADSISNGGMAVMKGDYLYFVNGASQADYDNTFGKVEKGSIVRAHIKDGKLSEYKILAPKNVFAKNKEAGFSIFGEWLYYVTPNNQKDKYGEDITDHADFMKVKIDGTESRRITTIKGLDVRYKFTDKNLVYLKNNNLYSIDITNDNFTEKTLVEDVTNVVMPNNHDYKVNQKLALTDFIYFNKKSSNKDIKGNELHAISPDGSINKTLINTESYIPENTLELNKNNYRYNLTLKNYLLTKKGITLYYTKANVIGFPSKEAQICSYTFDSKFEFDKTKENILTAKKYDEFIPYNENSIIISNSSNLYLGTSGKELKALTKSEENFAGKMKFVKDDYLYYTTSKGMDRVKIEVLEDTITLGDVSVVYLGKLDTGNFNNELIGNYYYFTNGKDYSYTNRFKIDESSIESQKEINAEFIGIMTEKDKLEKEKADNKD